MRARGTQRRRTTEQQQPRQASAVVVAITPRLLRREQAAAYLGISVPTLDAFRLRGEVTPVPVPAVHHAGETLRIPLYDRVDLDAVIERWKTTGGAR
jgi:hypothetical protein